MNDGNRNWGGFPASGSSADGPPNPPQGQGWTHQPGHGNPQGQQFPSGQQFPQHQGLPPQHQPQPSSQGQQHPGYPGPQNPGYPGPQNQGPNHPGPPGPNYPGHYPNNLPPAHINPTSKSRTPLIIGISAGAVVLIAAIVVALVMLRPGQTTVAAGQGSTATATPSQSSPSASATTPLSDAYTIRTDSQFGDNRDTHGWTCEGNDCRVENGKLRFTSIPEEGQRVINWWMLPERGWREDAVKRSRVTLQGLTFDEGEPRVNIKCAARIVDNRIVDAFQVEVYGDGTLAHYEMVDGEWQDAVSEDRIKGDTKNLGTVVVVCEERGPDFYVSIKIGDDLTSEVTYRNVNKSGATVFGYGGYGAKSEMSLSGITYEATR